MKIENISIICANTTRTKAYLQIMLKNNIFINKCYILTSDLEKLIERNKISIIRKKNKKYFDESESILYTLKKYNIEYEILNTENINDDIVLDKIKEMKEEYIIYSGFGGQILKSELFKYNKKFIHVHSGILPQYRGSTTFYYSILNEKKCGATAIFLNENIDEGNIIFEKEFDVPKENVDFDHIFDPFIRAEVLKEALKRYIKNKKFDEKPQNKKNENIYFIIHPILKYIAINSK
jgi:methionyl-tRNA formyltransferase